MNSLILSISACIAVVSVVVFVILKAAPRPETLPVTADWIDELSLDRYRPMMRLLDEEDFRMLRSQPGYTSRMEGKLRRQRCQIFRGYLRSLRSDFSRVCLVLKMVMAQAGSDRPDLAAALVRSQLAFACCLAAVQVRLALYVCGIGTVNVSSLLTLFDGMRVELRTLVPVSDAMGA